MIVGGIAASTEGPYGSWGQAKGLKAVGYKGPVVIETFTPTVKEIAKAAAIWRKLAPSQDGLAKEGLAFLRKLLR